MTISSGLVTNISTCLSLQPSIARFGPRLMMFGFPAQYLSYDCPALSYDRGSWLQSAFAPPIKTTQNILEYQFQQRFWLVCNCSCCAVNASTFEPSCGYMVFYWKFCSKTLFWFQKRFLSYRMSPAESPVTKNCVERIDETESGEPTCNQTSGNAVICSDMQWYAVCSSAHCDSAQPCSSITAALQRDDGPSCRRP